MMKTLAHLILICIICTQTSIAATFQCEYEISTNGTYGCKLKSTNTVTNDVTAIDGQHIHRKNDDDVKALQIRGNLKTFTSIFCQKFKNIEEIYVGDHEVGSLDRNAFGNCKNLKELFLSETKLQELPEDLLAKNLKLLIAWIHDNNFGTLPDKLFQNQHQLTELILWNNQLAYLPSTIFNQLMNLIYLDLQDNKLEFIDPVWFANLKNLKRLGIAGNQITELTRRMFKPLENLQRLWLYRNKIEFLHSDTFDGLQNLVELSLNENDISELPSGVFVPLKNLQQLKLYENKLKTVHSDSFGIHGNLTRIFLENNQIIAIDEKLIDHTAVSYLNMEGNLCSSQDIVIRRKIKPALKKCIDDYQPRGATRLEDHSDSGNCGKAMTGIGHIIGGSHIVRGSFPWIAALMTIDDDYFCGGTLMTNQKILTAAHCLQPKGATYPLLTRYFKVFLGSHNLKIQNEVGRVSYAIQSVHLNPGWNPLAEKFNDDIAVLVLEEKVIFNSRIQPICLMYENSQAKSINSGVVVGYGKSEDKTKLHENIPKIIDIPIHTNEDCFLKNSDLVRISSKKTFCGGYGNGTGVCNGDSGSGLFILYNGAYYLRGIVSSSLFTASRDCDVDNYSVFTDVPKYMRWVDGIGVE